MQQDRQPRTAATQTSSSAAACEAYGSAQGLLSRQRTMMRVSRISLSMRGRTPGLAVAGQYATPFAATCSLHAAQGLHPPSCCRERVLPA